MVGQFALGLAVTSPVIMLTNLQLRAVQATDARREFDFCDYWTLRIIMTSVAILIIFGVSSLSGYKGETFWIVIVVGFGKAFESLSDVIYGLAQLHERMDRIALSMILKGFLSLASMVLVLFLTKNVLWTVLAMAMSWAVLLWIYDIPMARDFLHCDSQSKCTLAWFSRKPAILWRLTWISLPLGIVMMLLSLNTNIPRYIIESYCGEYELGLFAALAYFMAAGHLIVGALGQSATPRMARYYSEGNRQAYMYLLLRLLGLGLVLAVAAYALIHFLGYHLLLIFYTVEYAENIEIFKLLVVSAGLGFLSSFLGYGITAARLFIVQLPLAGLVTVSTFTASYFLIPYCGILGGAYAILVSGIVQLLLCIFINMHAIRRSSS